MADITNPIITDFEEGETRDELINNLSSSIVESMDMNDLIAYASYYMGEYLASLSPQELRRQYILNKGYEVYCESCDWMGYDDELIIINGGDELCPGCRSDNIDRVD